MNCESIMTFLDGVWQQFVVVIAASPPFLPRKSKVVMCPVRQINPMNDLSLVNLPRSHPHPVYKVDLNAALLTSFESHLIFIAVSGIETCQVKSEQKTWTATAFLLWWLFYWYTCSEMPSVFCFEKVYKWENWKCLCFFYFAKDPVWSK